MEQGTRDLITIARAVLLFSRAKRDHGCTSSSAVLSCKARSRVHEQYGCALMQSAINICKSIHMVEQRLHLIQRYIYEGQEHVQQWRIAGRTYMKIIIGKHTDYIIYGDI